MDKLVATEYQDGVAVILVNNPPVNALSQGVPEGIASAIEAADSDTSVRAIVLMGVGKTFIAGADIKQLEDMAWGKGPGAPNLHELLQRIEDSSKPVVMAIHGAALGGGLECEDAAIHKDGKKLGRILDAIRIDRVRLNHPEERILPSQTLQPLVDQHAHQAESDKG